jgi:hypothetical protein
LHSLIGAAGLGHIDEYYPFPDYKLPTAVLTERFCREAPLAAADLSTTQRFESYEHPGVDYFPSLLAMPGLASAGLMHETANSFLFLATVDAGSETRRKLLGHQLGERAVGWSYSLRRRLPVRIVFHTDESDSRILVSKRSLFDQRREATIADDNMRLAWTADENEPLLSGTPLRYVLANHAHFGNWDGLLLELERFLAWAIRHFKIAGPGEALLDGVAIDATFANAVLSAPEIAAGRSTSPPEYLLFDREWSSADPMAASWYILRNVSILGQFRSLLRMEAFDCNNLRGLYGRLCKTAGVEPHFDRDLTFEARFQSLALNESFDSLREATLAAFNDSFVEGAQQDELVRLSEHVRHLQGILRRPGHRLVNKLYTIRRIPKRSANA